MTARLQRRVAGALALLCLHLGAAASSGSKTSVSTEGPDAELHDFRLNALEARVAAMPGGAERDYFEGVLANRMGDVDDSIHLLSDALPRIRESQPAHAAVALEALADDYTKSFRYDEAALAYDDLLDHFASQLDPHRLQTAKDDSGVIHLLRGALAQTVDWHGPVRLKTERNRIGSLGAELEVNGVREQWLLDTGANFSVVTQSFAKRLGLKPLPGFAQTTSGTTGIENPLQVGVLATLPLGGATLHNVVVLILEDSSLNIGLGKESYQISAIAGYPVFQALGAITFLHDGYFEGGERARRTSRGARMYMKMLTPVIACGVQGTTLPFTFDTGASGTNLSVRYYERFRAQDGSWKKGRTQTGGAGGIVERRIYLQPKVDLRVGDQTATLENVPIFPQKIGSSIDELYGNLGQDLVARFASFTLDFSSMSFSLGPPLPPEKKP